MRAVPFLLAIAAGCSSSSSATTASADVKAYAWKPQHGSAMAIVRRTADNLAHDPTGPRPDWVLYDPKGDQVVFVGGDAGYRRALGIAQAYDVAPPAPPPAPADVFSVPYLASPPPAPAPPLRGIHQVDDTDFTIERSMIDTLLSDPSQMARAARIVPAIKNGQSDGFKLYAIRPTSPIAALGFQNGDTVHAINGLDVSTPDKALEAYTQLKGASSVDVAITRRGRDFVLHYSIK
jgi:hypothetical protein